MTIGSLFSGIGGLELGLEWAGLGSVVWQVEKDPFCRRVLEKHWPGVRRYEDVREVGADLERVDLICGGFPCQDISSAGKGAGLAGERSGLWREFARVVNECRPHWVVVENVASGARRWVDAVVSELGQLGYEALPIPVSAQAVGAPHRRERVFIVAHAIGEPLRQQSRGCGGAGRQGPALTRLDGEDGVVAHASRARLEIGGSGRDASEVPAAVGSSLGGTAAHANQKSESTVCEHEQVGWLSQAASDGGWPWRPPVSPVCGVDDGVRDRVDRLRALGNAVVPQCAEVIGWVIRELESAGD